MTRTCSIAVAVESVCCGKKEGRERGWKGKGKERREDEEKGKERREDEEKGKERREEEEKGKERREDEEKGREAGRKGGREEGREGGRKGGREGGREEGGKGRLQFKTPEQNLLNGEWKLVRNVELGSTSRDQTGTNKNCPTVYISVVTAGDCVI